MNTPTISVVIPSYNRQAVLLDTIRQLLSQSELADEIIIVDQTDYKTTDAAFMNLQSMQKTGQIQWIRKNRPSIPRAMNTGLLMATSSHVLFIDDDVEFSTDFIREHKQVIKSNECLAHVGQIIQPWQSTPYERKNYSAGVGLLRDLEFPFFSNTSALIENCMAGNLCVNRQAAIDAGGFDERFEKTAYRFESEFCKRFCRHHDVQFLYVPQPSLNHLHISAGGTRAHGDFLTSIRPIYSTGNYYFAMSSGAKLEALKYILHQLIFSIKARIYLRKPWLIPVRMVAECWGLARAVAFFIRGPKLIDTRKS